MEKMKELQKKYAAIGHLLHRNQETESASEQRILLPFFIVRVKEFYLVLIKITQAKCSQEGNHQIKLMTKASGCLLTSEVDCLLHLGFH